MEIEGDKAPKKPEEEPQDKGVSPDNEDKEEAGSKADITKEKEVPKDDPGEDGGVEDKSAKKDKKKSNKKDGWERKII